MVIVERGDCYASLDLLSESVKIVNVTPASQHVLDSWV
jgi:hypothetical protein